MTPRVPVERGASLSVRLAVLWAVALLGAFVSVAPAPSAGPGSWSPSVACASAHEVGAELRPQLAPAPDDAPSVAADAVSEPESSEGKVKQRARPKVGEDLARVAIAPLTADDAPVASVRLIAFSSRAPPRR